MPIVMETFDEFCKRHGGEHLSQKVDKNLWIFPDGAAWRQGHMGPIPFEVPAATSDALNARRTFHATKVAIFAKAFENLKLALTGMGPTFNWNARDLGPDPGDGDDPVCGRRALLYLRTKHAEQVQALAEIDRQIEELPETKAKREREAKLQAMETARRAARDRVWDALKSIELETETPVTTPN